MTAPAALRPCPFCGKPPTVREHNGFTSISCDTLRCVGPETYAQTGNQSHKEWNTRASDEPRLRGSLEGLIAELDRLVHGRDLVHESPHLAELVAQARAALGAQAPTEDRDE